MPVTLSFSIVPKSFYLCPPLLYICSLTLAFLNVGPFSIRPSKPDCISSVLSIQLEMVSSENLWSTYLNYTSSIYYIPHFYFCVSYFFLLNWSLDSCVHVFWKNMSSHKILALLINSNDCYSEWALQPQVTGLLSPVLVGKVLSKDYD